MSLTTQDLLGYLYKQWLDSAPHKTKDEAIVEEFAKFAQSFLANNPPVTFDFMSRGNGVTLSNGTRLNFIPDELLPGTDMQQSTGSIPVVGTQVRYSDMQYSPFVSTSHFNK